MIGFAVLFGLLAVFLAQTWLNNQADERMKSLEAQRKAPPPARTIVVANRPLRFGDELAPLGAARNAVAGGCAAGRRVRQDRGSDRDQARRADADRRQRSDPCHQDHRTGPARDAVGGARRRHEGRHHPGQRRRRRRRLRAAGRSCRCSLDAAGDKNVGITDVVITDVRVLAIDQLADQNTDKPSVVKAVTLEVNVTDGEKIALASTVGTLSLLLSKAGEIAGRRYAARDARRSRQAERCRRRIRASSPCRRQPAVEEFACRIHRADRAGQCAVGGTAASGAGAKLMQHHDDTQPFKRSVRRGFWGLLTSGGEADVKNHTTMKRTSAAAKIPRHSDRGNNTGGVAIAAWSRRGWTRAALVAALALAFVPAAAHAQQQARDDRQHRTPPR